MTIINYYKLQEDNLNAILIYYKLQ